MEIIFNKNFVETKEIDGEPCILLTGLINLSGVHFTQIYQKLRQKYSLHKYIRGGCRKRYITLEGCIKLLESFREPNDALINVLRDCTKKEEPSKAPTPEKLIELEMKRLDKEKLNFVDLEKRVETLGNKINEIEVGNSLFGSHVQDFIDSVYDRLADIENSLGKLNDKPNQCSFKDLLKECIKEIIKEELCK